MVDQGEVYWWMGRLGLTMRDVLTNPSARLCLGRALGARYFLMGSLREVASFDVSTHVIDAELNGQVYGAQMRVSNSAELRYRLPELANVMFLPPQQQVVVIQQQQVVQRQVVAAQLEFRKGNFSVSLGLYKEVLAANPNCVEARHDVDRPGVPLPAVGRRGRRRSPCGSSSRRPCRPSASGRSPWPRPPKGPGSRPGGTSSS